MSHHQACAFTRRFHWGPRRSLRMAVQVSEVRFHRYATSFLQRHPIETPPLLLVCHHCVVTSSLWHHWAAPLVTPHLPLLALIDDSTTLHASLTPIGDPTASCADDHSASSVLSFARRRPRLVVCLLHALFLFCALLFLRAHCHCACRFRCCHCHCRCC